MSPLDVVKIRLQAQQKPFKVGSCFIYSNGLMDCLCVCSHCHGDANSKNSVSSRIRPWYERPGHFKGTLVSSFTYMLCCHLLMKSIRPTQSVTICCNFCFHCQDAFIKITRTEGVTALWSGLPPTL